MMGTAKPMEAAMNERRGVAWLVAALLLLVANDAWAGCAWVLWSKLHISKNPGDDWSVHSTYTSQQECGSALNASMDGAKTKFSATVFGNVAIVTGKDGAPLWTMQLLCTPDTVDPRPRGKE